jgi:putative SOS response-associated peptidase YedK
LRIERDFYSWLRNSRPSDAETLIELLREDTLRIIERASVVAQNVDQEA